MNPQTVSFGSTEKAPAVAGADLQYGDIVYCEINAVRPSDESNFIGAYLGTTALGAVILCNLDDWQRFQRGLMGNTDLRVRSAFEVFKEDGGESVRVAVFRKLGSFTAHPLGVPGQ